jgi:hypothetical protein
MPKEYRGTSIEFKIPLRGRSINFAAFDRKEKFLFNFLFAI